MIFEEICSTDVSIIDFAVAIKSILCPNKILQEGFETCSVGSRSLNVVCKVLTSPYFKNQVAQNDNIRLILWFVIVKVYHSTCFFNNASYPIKDAIFAFCNNY